MRTLFYSAALICCGPLISYASPVHDPSNHIVTTRYFFNSATDLARQIKDRGIIQSVATLDGNVQFTGMNYTGIKPSNNASLAYVHFGRAPYVVTIVIDPEAAKAARKREGVRLPGSIVVDWPGVKKAGRPDAPGADPFDPKIIPG
jgi:hypothetical protein